MGENNNCVIVHPIKEKSELIKNIASQVKMSEYLKKQRKVKNKTEENYY